MLVSLMLLLATVRAPPPLARAELLPGDDDGGAAMQVADEDGGGGGGGARVDDVADDAGADGARAGDEDGVRDEHADEADGGGTDADAVDNAVDAAAAAGVEEEDEQKPKAKAKPKERVAAKIVDAPVLSTYNAGGTGTGQYGGAATAAWQTMTERTDFAVASGPRALRALAGKCFSCELGSYRYELCPFRNVTQTEVQARWGAFSAVLGVYRGWGTDGEGFYSHMRYGDGDFCGSKRRQVRVRVLCGPHDNAAEDDEYQREDGEHPHTNIAVRTGATREGVLSVREPQPCSYELNFVTPLRCELGSMLADPADDLVSQPPATEATGDGADESPDQADDGGGNQGDDEGFLSAAAPFPLTESVREKILRLERMLKAEELTAMGFIKRKRQVFVDAGFELRAHTDDGSPTEGAAGMLDGADGKASHGSDAADGQLLLLGQCEESLHASELRVQELERKVCSLRRQLGESVDDDDCPPGPNAETAPLDGDDSHNDGYDRDEDGGDGHAHAHEGAGGDRDVAADPVPGQQPVDAEGDDAGEPDTPKAADGRAIGEEDGDLGNGGADDARSL